MHSSDKNIEIMMNYAADEVIDELLNHTKRISKQVGRINESQWLGFYVHLLHYKYHKTNPII